MPGNFKTCLLLIILRITVILNAQQPAPVTQAMEDLLYRNESAILPESSIYELYESGLLKVDLNSSSPEQLEETGLFTPYQLNNLLEYREKYGEIYSIYELAAIPGFQTPKVKEIQSSLSTGHVKKKNATIPDRNMLLFDLGRVFPEKTDGREGPASGEVPAFDGSPLKTTLRLSYRPFRRLSLALTYEKDPGEPFLYRNRPQYLSGYLCISGKKSLKQLVAGSFRMNQGLGLVNGSGFIHQAGKLVVNRYTLSRLRPYASKTETGFDQGIACQFEVKNIALMTWLSYNRLAISPSAFTENGDPGNWLEYQRTTGLFRTAGELEGRELAFRVHTGIQALYRNKRLAVGILSSSRWAFPTKKAMKYLETRPVSSFQQNVSLHANWQKSRIHLFGELASGNCRSPAILIGTNFYFNDFVQGGMLLHYYGAGYRGANPSSYGSGSTINNEEGAAFHLHVETGRYFIAELTGEIFRYPSPRYLTRVPSSGYHLDLSFQSPANNLLQCRIRLVDRAWQTTPENTGTGVRPIVNFRVTRMDGLMIYRYGKLFKWQSRLVLSSFSQQDDRMPGYAALQQVTVGSPAKLHTTLQFILFKVDDWDNRIYLYEPGFYYSFSFPPLYGDGHKTTLLLTLKPARRITFSTKVNFTVKGDTHSWETGIQLRLNL